MSEESILKLQDSGPVFIVPVKRTGVSRTWQSAGFSIAIDNSGGCHWRIFNRWIKKDLLGDPPYADVVIAMFFKALKPILFRTIRGQRQCNEKTTVGSMS